MSEEGSEASLVSSSRQRLTWLGCSIGPNRIQYCCQLLSLMRSDTDIINHLRRLDHEVFWASLDDNHELSCFKCGDEFNSRSACAVATLLSSIVQECSVRRRCIIKKVYMSFRGNKVNGRRLDEERSLKAAGSTCL